MQKHYMLIVAVFGSTLATSLPATRSLGTIDAKAPCCLRAPLPYLHHVRGGGQAQTESSSESDEEASAAAEKSDEAENPHVSSTQDQKDSSCGQFFTAAVSRVKGGLSAHLRQSQGDEEESAQSEREASGKDSAGESEHKSSTSSPTPRWDSRTDSAQSKEDLDTGGREPQSAAQEARELSSQGQPAPRREESTDSWDSESSEQDAANRRKRKRAFEARIKKEKAPEYQDTRPMVCKEFAETGTCRYGNTCIFLHDRASYYDRWKDKVRAHKKRARHAALLANRISEHCPLCKQHYTEPVSTECGHHFCARCIIERYDAADGMTRGREGAGEGEGEEGGEAGGPGGAGGAPGAGQGGRGEEGDGGECPVCGEALHGNFHVAYDLQDKLNKQQLPQESSVIPLNPGPGVLSPEP
jgi:hypothetical protein